jgi:hypothetical protein
MGYAAWSTALYSKDFWSRYWKLFLIVSVIGASIISSWMTFTGNFTTFGSFFWKFFELFFIVLFIQAYFGSWIYHFYYNHKIKKHIYETEPRHHRCKKCKEEVHQDDKECSHCNAFLASVGIEAKPEHVAKNNKD